MVRVEEFDRVALAALLDGAGVDRFRLPSRSMHATAEQESERSEPAGAKSAVARR
jgi:hypothetical protein